jgi:ATP-dependent Clp protease ATP-binding subunit ClpB
MRFDKYTQKAQAAILDAQSLAEEQNNTTIDPEHLLLALIRQKGGVVPSLLGRMGTDVASLERSIEQLVAGKAKVTGGSGQVSMNREVNNILREAEAIAANMKDEYVSTEHILLAMVGRRVRR